jgi:hypothetical protein
MCNTADYSHDRSAADHVQVEMLSRVDKLSTSNALLPSPLMK